MVTGLNRIVKIQVCRTNDEPLHPINLKVMINGKEGIYVIYISNASYNYFRVFLNNTIIVVLSSFHFLRIDRFNVLIPTLKICVEDNVFLNSR